MYKRGEIEIGGQWSDSRADRGEWLGPVVSLPHSCGEWVIGGREQVEALIQDLQGVIDGTIGLGTFEKKPEPKPFKRSKSISPSMMLADALPALQKAAKAIGEEQVGFIPRAFRK